MFSVLQAPFPSEPQANDNAHAILVYEGARNTRILIQSLAQSQSKKAENVLWLELACIWLNDSPSVEFLRPMLRSIKETWQQSDAIRRRQFQPRRESFGADFGRLDLGRPGQGGSGFDGVW